MTAEEPRYTLAEATRELARQEYRTRGHSWDVIETMAGPIAIRCDTCGQRHNIREADET